MCVRDLGIFINAELNWVNHILNMCKGAKRLCAWIFSIFHTRDKEVMLTVFNSLVRSKVEYCCEIWCPSKIKLINEVENIQRRFTKRISHMFDLNYWDRIKMLNILSLQRRRERMTLILVWKIKNSKVPNDVGLEFSSGPRNLKSGLKAVIKPMPRVQGKALSSFEESFIVRAAKLWNSLPALLREIPIFSSFINTLDRYLKNIPDRPPVNGYYHENNNSITSYDGIDVSNLC